MNISKFSTRNKYFQSYGIIRAVMIILGCIFIIASIPKILHPKEFAEIVFNYQVIPDEWINLFAIVLPWIECVTGIFLVLYVWAPGSVIIANLLLVSFVTVLAYDLIRGLDIRCGCFSTNINAAPANLLYIFRDMIFLIMGIFLFFNIIIRGISKG